MTGLNLDLVAATYPDVTSAPGSTETVDHSHSHSSRDVVV